MRRLPILLLSSQVLAAGCMQSPSLNATEIASKHPEVAAFLKENPNAFVQSRLLTATNKTELAERYPVIYGNLPDHTIYEVDYQIGNRGLLVITDSQNQSVVRVFKTTGIILS